MIKIQTTTPSQCYINSITDSELELLKKELTYTDTGVMFNLKALKKNKWLQKNRPDAYNARLKELNANLVTCMLKYDEKAGKYWFRPGSIPYLQEKMAMQVESLVEYPETSPVVWRKPLPFDLYPYQFDSVKALTAARHACVEICTGGGKTAILLTMARELGLQTVIVTPSRSIFLEILEKFEYYFGKNKVGAFGDGKKRFGKLFTVCISKSLTTLKEGTPEYDFFKKTQVILSDESHLNAATTLEEVFYGVLADAPYRFFVSGTQVRGDGKDKLLESIIGKKVFELTTKDAIAGGYICPVKFIILETTSPDMNNYGDPLKTKRKHFLYNDNIAALAAKIANASWNHAQESTLILVEELCQIKAIADKLNVPYGYAHSASKKDAAKYGLVPTKSHEQVEAFNRGEIKVLMGTSCISTGTNMYPCHNTINVVAGSSEVKTKQGAVGRSVRVLEKSQYKEFHKPKPFSKIYDFKIVTNKKLPSQVSAKVESNLKRLQNALDKRVGMYSETTNDISYIKVTQ